MFLLWLRIEGQVWFSNASVAKPEFLSSMHVVMLPAKWSCQINQVKSLCVILQQNMYVQQKIEVYLWHISWWKGNSNKKANNDSNKYVYNNSHTVIWIPKKSTASHNRKWQQTSNRIEDWTKMNKFQNFHLPKELEAKEQLSYKPVPHISRFCHMFSDHKDDLILAIQSCSTLLRKFIITFFKRTSGPSWKPKFIKDTQKEVKTV